LKSPKEKSLYHRGASAHEPQQRHRESLLFQTFLPPAVETAARIAAVGPLIAVVNLTDPTIGEVTYFVKNAC
jgi:hypothetical protein